MNKMLHEGAAIFFRSLRAKITGFKKYKGSAEDICGQIVKDCWNGEYFQASTRNYPIFYTRDFSYCTEGLIKLGYREEVEKTLQYALACFREKSVSAAIRKGKPFDFPAYSVDSLPLLMRSIRVSKSRQLVKEYAEFLNDEAEMFYSRAIDSGTGMVRKRHFSSIRDYSVRNSSCYDNCMAGLLSRELKLANLVNPLRDYDYRKILKTFWNGKYFKNDSESGHLCADANIFPFWTGLIGDEKMMRAAFKSMQEERLDEPIPLKYVRPGIKERMIAAEAFVPGWERNNSWGHLGMLYIKMLQRIDRKKAAMHIGQYRQKIEKNRTFPEVLNEKGSPYSSLFYLSDEGMLWSSMFLELVK